MDKKDINKYRQDLGETGKKLTDEQVETRVVTLKKLAEILIEEYIKNKND